MAKNGEIGPIRLNRATMQMILDGGLGMEEALRDEANQIAAKARSIADGFRVSGEYQDNIEVVQDSSTDRARFLVRVSVRHAPFVERHHSVMARAASAGSNTKKHLTSTQKAWRQKSRKGR